MTATPAPHVPAFFVKAGGGAAFSARCARLLAQKGYTPEDFGSHDQVQARIKAAKKKCEAYDRYMAAQAKGDPSVKAEPKPSDKERMLSKCQSGHLAQDALFREKGGRKDACKNNSPPQGDGRLYEENEAPCMPMLSHGSTGSTKATIGSPHWAVGQNEKAFTNANKGQVISDDDLSGQCQANAAMAVQDASSKKDYDQHMKDAATKRDRPWTPARQKEAQQRRQDASALQRGAAGEATAQGAQGAGKKGPDTIDGKTAAECIEVFRKKASEQMRRNAVKKYGTDYKETEKAAKDAQAAADAKVAAAQKRIDDGKAAYDKAKAAGASKEELKALRDETGKGYRDRNIANREKKDADRQVANLPCLHAQACSVAGVSPTASDEDKKKAFDASANKPMPPFQGFVPS